MIMMDGRTDMDGRAGEAGIQLGKTLFELEIQ